MTQDLDGARKRPSGRVARGLDRVATPRAADLVASQLRQHIVHDLGEGQTLPPEAVLMGTFGVSRQTLREGLRILEADGLVTVRRGALGGAIIHRPDGAAVARNAALILQFRNTTIADVFQARAVVEPACAEMLAAAQRPQDVDHLRRTAAEAADAAKHFDPIASIRAHMHFHAEVTQLAGNQTLTLLSDVIRRITELGSERRVMSDPDSAKTRRALKAGHLAHLRLVDLIEAGDADAAREHWKAHLTGSEDFLFELHAKTVVDLFS